MPIFNASGRAARWLTVVVTAASLAGCGGGGGGGNSAPRLGLDLSPSSWQATFFSGTVLPFGVDAEVTGTVSGPVTVIIRDEVGVIQPNVSVFQVDEDLYRAEFQTAPGLAPGRYTGNIDIDLCSNAGCSTRYGGANLPFDLTVNAAPAITSLAPASVLAGSGGFTLAVNGQGFTPASVVRWGGLPRTTTFVSAGQLTIAVDENDVSAAGTVYLSVATPQAGAPEAITANAALPVLNPPPVIASLQPATVLVGSDDTQLVVEGIGFRPSSRIVWNGEERENTQFWSATRLVLTLDAGELATPRLVSVAVSTPAPGGGTSTASTFTVANPAPVIGAVDPGSTSVGCPQATVAVQGTGFLPDSQLLFNGVPRTVSYVSPTRLATTVSGAELATARELAVQVRNSGPGGGTSAAVQFPVRVTGFASTAAVASRVDAQNTGAAGMACPSAMPGAPTWTYETEDLAGIPVIAGGRVFVQTDDEQPFTPTSTLFALNGSDGSLAWGPQVISGTLGLGYGEGRLFVTIVGTILDDYEATLRALNPATGETLWSVTLGTQHYDMAPVVANGRVYVVLSGDARAVYAFDPATGAQLWSASPTIATTQPAVTADGVYLAYSCAMQMLDATTGALVWGASQGCSGGGAGMPVVGGGSVLAQAYVSGGSPWSWIRRDPATGAEQGVYVDSSLPPAVSGSTRFSVDGGQLRAFAMTANAGDPPSWVYPAVLGGAQGVRGAPLVVNESVFVTDSSGFDLVAVDAATGRERWRGSHAGGFSGVIAGDGLVVSSGFRIQAFRVSDIVPAQPE